MNNHNTRIDPRTDQLLHSEHTIIVKVKYDSYHEMDKIGKIGRMEGVFFFPLNYRLLIKFFT